MMAGMFRVSNKQARTHCWSLTFSLLTASSLAVFPQHSLGDEIGVCIRSSTTTQPLLLLLVLLSNCDGTGACLCCLYRSRFDTYFSAAAHATLRYIYIIMLLLVRQGETHWTCMLYVCTTLDRERERRERDVGVGSSLKSAVSAVAAVVVV